MTGPQRPPPELTVGQLPARSGVAVSALHFYEAQGPARAACDRPRGRQPGHREQRTNVRSIAVLTPWLEGLSRASLILSTVMPVRPLPAGPAPRWVDGTTWIVAVDYDSGCRVVFGRGDAPAVPLPDAVVASCSIPGWYRPAEIGGRRYVDGGVRSLTSLGLMAEAGVDEFYVLAPMASTVTDWPGKPHERLERTVRGLATRALLRDARRLHARGITVTALTPGPEDLAAMGVNPMDARRREAVLDAALRTSPASLARPRVLASLPG